MAAVAASQVPEGLRGLDHEQFAEPGTSRFTAVNGRGSPATAMKTKNPNEETTKAANDESNIRPSQSGDRRGRQASPGPPQQDEHEQRSTTIENHSYPSNNSRSPSSQRAKSTKQSPLKRKRSDSEEFENSRGPPYHGHGFPTGVETQSAPSPEASMARVTPSDHPRDRPATEFQRERERERERVSPESYLGPPSMSARAYEPQHERPQPLSSEYNPHAQTTQQERPYYTHHHDTSDVRLVEALQRENHSYRQGQIRDHYGSPDDDEQRRQQYAEYNTNRSSVSGADADRAKRRKRVFSNRTKTGCMTCRKRKKKCDEAHPECNNCHRGGFVCEGYTTRNTWQKPTPSKAPIPLQSKTGYADGPHRDQHNQPRYANEISPEYAPRATTSHQQLAASDGDRVKPIILDEEREPPRSISSPPRALGKATWAKVPRPYPSHPPHLSKYQPDVDHRPISAVHEIPHEVPDSVSIYQPTASHRSHASHSGHSSVPLSSHNAPAVAQAALQRTPSSQRPSPHHRIQLTEREKMLRGEYYLPYTTALIEDREKCAAAVWRFNNATNPTNGVSPEERLRFFKAILSLKPSQEPTPGPGSDGRNSADPPYLPVGSVGPDVVVEAPFHCDYGYNINIGENVVIGPDCRITDTCAVTIGNNVVFSPNVKLVCATYAIDPKERRKGKGRALGRNIIIEDDVWIGSNVTILPGVRVGRCSTVGAGSLIHKEVPPYTVVAGNPQKVVRGIYDANSN